MRLKVRFVLAVNAVIIAYIAAFFFIDEYRLRSVYSEAVGPSAEAGIHVRGIAERVYRDLADLVHDKETRQRIRADLRGMAYDLQPQGVLEVRLADSIQSPVVIASMTGESERRAEEKGREEMLVVSRKERQQLNAALQKPNVGFVVNLHKHRGEWVMRVLIPHTWYREKAAGGASDLIEEIGLIEIFLAAGQIRKTGLKYRLMHMLFALLLALSLTALISATTDRIVLRPLDRLTEMIRRAEAGKPSLERNISSK